MTPTSNPRRAYSPFWAILVVFVALILLQGAYVLDDLRQRNQIRLARAQLSPVLTQAQTITQTTEAVSRELLALSTNSPEAARIIAEFKIQLSNPPPSR